MPTRPCADCGKETSETAPACPHCGRPNPDVAKKERRQRRGNVQGSGFLLMLLGLLLGMVSPVIGGIAFLVGLIVLVVGLVL